MKRTARVLTLSLSLIAAGLVESTGAQEIDGATQITNGRRFPRADRPTSDRVGTFTLNRPVGAVHAPGDTERLFIWEKRGIIQILDLASETINGTPFMDINSKVVNVGGNNDERGLLGLAFHPDYASNDLFYVNYINNGGDTVVAEYEVTANPDIGDSSSERILMTINQPQGNHNGGWIGFSPLDGYLYIATGDGGNFCDQGSGHVAGGNSQDITSNLLGKMLRIDPLGNNGPGGNYGIPNDNPFVGVTGDDEIWSYGLRNPWRCSFDSANGDLYIGDVGQGTWEEIEYEPALTSGRNYGWRCMEGLVCSSVSGCSTSGCTCLDPGLTDPIHVYGTGGCTSVTGGYVYRGSGEALLKGTYLYADYCSNRIWSFIVVNGEKTRFRIRFADFSPSVDGWTITSVASFGEDADGELYIIDQDSGRIFKVIPQP